MKVSIRREKTEKHLEQCLGYGSTTVNVACYYLLGSKPQEGIHFLCFIPCCVLRAWNSPRTKFPAEMPTKLRGGGGGAGKPRVLAVPNIFTRWQ